MILRQMVNLYVTIKGFAFAETCLEMYKETKEMRRKACGKKWLLLLEKAGQLDTNIDIAIAIHSTCNVALYL